jgi:hypothetical protein
MRLSKAGVTPQVAGSNRRQGLQVLNGSKELRNTHELHAASPLAASLRHFLYGELRPDDLAVQGRGSYDPHHLWCPRERLQPSRMQAE